VTKRNVCIPYTDILVAPEIERPLLRYQAVGKIGGTGSSSSPGVSGDGVVAGGVVPGVGFGGIDGLKSGSGEVCDSLFMSNPLDAKSTIFIILCAV
jgi:hypothetical protein